MWESLRMFMLYNPYTASPKINQAQPAGASKFFKKKKKKKLPDITWWETTHAANFMQQCKG